jgi:HEAT repeat protein
LVSATQPGATPFRARPAAITALGALTRGLEGRDRERGIEALVDRLRDASPRSRRAAIEALVTAEASEAAEAIERCRGPLARQDQVFVDRALARLRKAPGPRVKAAEDQIEQLRATVRKLEERLESVEAKRDVP